MPGLLTRSNAAAARFFAFLTFLAAYVAFEESEYFAALVIALSGVILWKLSGDPHNHGAIRRVSGGVLWMVLGFFDLGIAVT